MVYDQLKTMIADQLGVSEDSFDEEKQFTCSACGRSDFIL